MADRNANNNNPIFTVLEAEEEAESFLEERSDHGCGCFRSFPCFGSSRDQRPAPELSAWISKRARSVREFSEVVAGPKWKNLLRRVGGYFTKNNKRRPGFQYDSFDYALNFDDGLCDGEEEERLARGFSARFVAPAARATYQEQKLSTST